MSKSQNPERGFKRSISTAYDHQRKVHERTPDKKNDHNAHRHQDDRTEADSHPCHRGKTVILVSKQADGLETEREQSRHNPADASANERVDQRLAQTAFALH